MLVTLKPHSTFLKFFDKKEYKVEINSYYDIEFYLASVHPRFKKYISTIKQGLSNESFTYVTQDLKTIKRNEYNLKKPKDGAIIYIAPVITGGGGKRGQLALAIGLALVGGYAAGGGFGAGFSFDTLGTNVSGFFGGFGEGGGGLGTLFSGLDGIPSFIKGIMGNLAISLITSLFTSRPKGKSIEVAKDSGTRTENNIFGSLQNTTQPGTAIALNYGLMRVGGQFLSGYILSQQHAQNDAPSIAQIFNSNESPLAAEARAEE
tara:strand:+ start:3775 stop:4560 length:786 start_codon:yes stop_codon:yes gene_type:complete